MYLVPFLRLGIRMNSLLLPLSWNTTVIIPELDLALLSDQIWNVMPNIGQDVSGKNRIFFLCLLCFCKFFLLLLATTYLLAFN